MKFKFRAILPAIVVVGIVGMFFVPDINLTFTENQVNTIVKDKLPAESGTAIIKHTVLEADISFNEDGTATVKARVSSKVANRDAVTSTITGTAIPVYHNSAIYLDRFKLIKFETDFKRPEAGSTGKLGETARAFGVDTEALKDVIFENTKNDQAFFGAEELATSATQFFLDKYPVYDLKGRDMKHDVASWALNDIQVSGDKVTIVLSPATLTTRILVTALFCVMAVIMFAAMVRTGFVGFFIFVE